MMIVCVYMIIITIDYSINNNNNILIHFDTFLYCVCYILYESVCW